MSEKIFRVLSLDGGGAKGFYTLGILREIEAMIGCRLHERFDLIFGTSTGSIITAMLALAKSVPEIIALYQDHVPTVMKNKDADGRSGALAKLSKTIFGDAMFTDVKTSVGIVTTKWVLEKPMIFKTHIGQAHGMKGSFVPGFGVKIGDAVQASCSAYPYFNRKTIVTSSGDNIELIDGGFCQTIRISQSFSEPAMATDLFEHDLKKLNVLTQRGVHSFAEHEQTLRSFLL